MKVLGFTDGAEVSMGQLAARAVEVGEAHNLMYELRRVLGDQVTQQIEVKIDASEVQATVDKAISEVSVYGEIDRAYKVLPPEPKRLHDKLYMANRIAFHAQFDRDPNSTRYRDALLYLAALTVHAIKELDNEQQR